jgi:hypothetical protein
VRACVRATACGGRINYRLYSAEVFWIATFVRCTNWLSVSFVSFVYLIGLTAEIHTRMSPDPFPNFNKIKSRCGEQTARPNPFNGNANDRAPPSRFGGGRFHVVTAAVRARAPMLCVRACVNVLRVCAYACACGAEGEGDGGRGMGGNLTVQKRAKPCSYLYTRSGRYLPRVRVRCCHVRACARPEAVASAAAIVT